MLAQRLKSARNVPARGGVYLASEKLDGVRAAWDGRDSLWTRGGQRIRAPPSFASKMPRGVPLDGELFAGRGRFKDALALYSSPSDAGWKGALQYRVFDMPTERRPFRNVASRLAELFPECTGTSKPFSPTVCRVSQRRMSSSELDNFYRAVIADRGEGVMLRRANAPYRGGRSSNIFKLKKVSDAEAVVIGYSTGTRANTVGALVARWPDNTVTFKVGSGLNDARGRNARALFPIGSMITVQFMELTEAGRPRHPVFKGARTDL